LPTFKITLAYDGASFVGWQRQAEGVSIQGLIEDALRDLDARDVAVAGAGRTDAGVHALGQVASFALERSIDPATVARSLNAKLPAAVRVIGAERAAADFHARFDATAKTYCYRIWIGAALSPFERAYAWHLPGPLDLDAMTAAARLVEGTHDFASFQAAGSDAKTSVRTVLESKLATAEDTLRVPRGGELLTYTITGDGFLRHMVRAIAGSLVDVGRGRQRPEWIAEVMASRDRTRAGRTAPAHGLFLVSVEYASANWGGGSRRLADEA
jgi:tRNA pseudouridine38-40 synthase